MKRILAFSFLALGVAFFAAMGQAQAQATRTWVSGVGDDVNPCSRTAPCKTFAGAISKTAAGGEIDALDPGGFGTLTITKALTIDGGGGQVSSALASGTSAFNINAGANDKVVLRNLRINGIGQSTSPGTNGIVFNTGLQLDLENVFIFGFSNLCVDFEPNVRAFLTITNSVFQGCAVGGLKSTTTATTGGANKVAINNTTISGSGYGIWGGTNSKLQLFNVTIDACAVGGGDYALIADGTAAEVNVDSSVIANNNQGGLRGRNSGTMRVSNSSITGNNLNGILFDGGGSVSSYGNNRVNGNSGVQAFSTPLLTQT
jgi:hypothetical protein